MRNISYSYGDSNMMNAVRTSERLPKHFIPLWGQQRLEFFRGCVRDRKHFIPLRGQQQTGNRAVHLGLRNISYPYGDSNRLATALSTLALETFHTPMGTATPRSACSASQSSVKHFTPLRGQQHSLLLAILHDQVDETFHTPMGTATATRIDISSFCDETFHPPMGTATAHQARS